MTVTNGMGGLGWDDGILKTAGGMSLGEKATLVISRFVCKNNPR